MKGRTIAKVESWFNTAITAHKQGKLTVAAKWYHKVLEHAPKHADALHLLGVIANQHSDFKRAKFFIEKAITINPKPAIFHSNLGNSYRGLNMLQDAEQEYRKALYLDPKFIDAQRFFMLVKGFKAISKKGGPSP